MAQLPEKPGLLLDWRRCPAGCVLALLGTEQYHDATLHHLGLAFGDSRRTSPKPAGFRHHRQEPTGHPRPHCVRTQRSHRPRPGALCATRLPFGCLFRLHFRHHRRRARHLRLRLCPLALYGSFHPHLLHRQAVYRPTTGLYRDGDRHHSAHSSPGQYGCGRRIGTGHGTNAPSHLQRGYV